MENTDFIALSECLNHPRRILLTSHTNPDGDAIGASLALASYFKKKNHDVRVMIPDLYPDFLAWMPGTDEILIFKDNPDLCTKEINRAELIFAVDYNNFDRINHAGDLVRKTSATKVLIDHHLYPSDDFNLKLSVSSVSSTSELVYKFIEASNDLALIDQPIAENIYTGIITDTGSLSYSCNYVSTYLIIADLFRRGIDGEHIHRLVYDTYSESRLRLLGYSISHQLIVIPDLHTAYITLSKSDLEKFNHQIGDTEGIVNYALSIKDINLAALFMERDDCVKISFRSKGKFSVDTFARDYFKGGGHRNASGANCKTTLDETVQLFLKLLPQFQENLTQVY